MFVFVPILAWFLIFIFTLKDLPILKKSDIRERILLSVIVWGTLVIIFTEVLSYFNYYNFQSLLFIWTIVICILVMVIFLISRIEYINLHPIILNFQNFSDLANKLLLPVFGIILLAGLLALFTAPNNPDAMSYHLARIEHWIQNQTVAFYPTNIVRQNYMAPGAEFIVAQFRIFSGGDRLSNAVQWMSLIGVILGISLITKIMGGNYLTQIFSIIFTVTIPMGILQASSAQNDLVVSLWLVCFIYFGLLSAKTEKIYHYIFSSLSLGLALLTKGTAYTFALPFLIWFLFVLFRKNKKSLIIYCLTIFLSVILLNLGYYLRNINFYGVPIGSSYNHLNSNISLIAGLSNMIKNTSMHFWLPSTVVNTFFYDLVIKIHKILGISVNDPSLNWYNARFSFFSIIPDENIAINPLHLFIIFITLFFYLIKRLKLSRGFILSLISALFLFSLLLRWSIWNSRYHLPLFIIWSVPVAFFWNNINQKITMIVIYLLLITSLYYLFFNNLKPIISSDRSIINIPRDVQYFNGRFPEYFYASRTVNAIMSHEYANIGFIVDDEFRVEYPFIALLRNSNYKFRIEHLEVTNKSSTLIRKKFTPDVILYIGSDKKIITKYSNILKVPLIVLN